MSLSYLAGQQVGFGMLAVAILALVCRGNGGPNLVPSRASTAPDYFCTWNIQGYACSYSGAAATRALINEQSLFKRGWLDFYPSIRKDLLFVMDDSWDVPPNGNERALGRLQLDEAKFPDYPSVAALASAVKERGWRGLGGWVCAQECPLLPRKPLRDYWADRLKGLKSLSYLKVDWGAHDQDVSWRQMLAELKATCCPATVIEAAMTPDAIRFADTYRTYDVETVISAPTTLGRITSLLASPSAKGSPAIINCEDEVLIGAGLGCAYGIMRHPLSGPLPDGRQDFVFPPTCRDLKRRMDEVTRAVRWHRIAPPLPIGVASFNRSSNELTDRWTMQAGESWTGREAGSIASATAPAIMARGMKLPSVRCDETELPFVCAARYLNGCLSIATIGRALGRTYRTPLADIRVEGGTIHRPIGVFGRFKSLSIAFDRVLKPKAIWAQDLASNRSENIAGQVQIHGNVLTLPGSLIERIGRSAAHAGDVSDPGLVLVVH